MKRGHVPVRMCIICRSRAAQAELTRFVLTPEGLAADPQPHRQGRGWYVCGKATCRERLPRYRPKKRSA